MLKIVRPIMVRDNSTVLIFFFIKMLFFICFFAKIEAEKGGIVYFKWKGKISVLKGRNVVLNWKCKSCCKKDG
jgi:hypothetical protein